MLIFFNESPENYQTVKFHENPLMTPKLPRHQIKQKFSAL